MSWNGKPTSVVISRLDPEREKAAAVHSDVASVHWTPEQVSAYLTTKYGQKLDRPQTDKKVNNYGW